MFTCVQSLLRRCRLHFRAFALAALAAPFQAQAANIPSQLVNISVRQVLLPGESMTLGFVIAGNSPARILLRGVGPTLQDYSVINPMRNPKITLTSQIDPRTAATAVNDDWGGATAVSSDRIKVLPTVMEAGFPLQAGSLDAAMLVELQPGPYTLVLSGSTSTDNGIVLAEVYDTKPSAATGGGRLINLSALGHINQGSALIAGFVVKGDPLLGASERVLIRAGGPALTSFGVSDAIPDPRFDLTTAVGKSLRSNDNWTDDGTLGQGSVVQSAALALGAPPYKAGSRDAAVFTTVTPGSFTVIARDSSNTAGTVLVELYELSDSTPAVLPLH